MAAAFGWGTLAASSLVIGALVGLWFHIGLRTIGLIMGFGAGVLISAVAFDLSVGCWLGWTVEVERLAGGNSVKQPLQLLGRRCWRP